MLSWQGWCSIATVQIFSKQEFETALPKHRVSGVPLWTCIGIVNGEYVYEIPVVERPGIALRIRSSVHSNGWSADAGDDSIRIWVVDAIGQPMFAKEDAWTTRVTGWQTRMLTKLRVQYKKALELKKCQCGGWLQEREGKFGVFIGCTNYPVCRHTEKAVVRPQQLRLV